MSKSCDGKSAQFHRHRARVIIKKAYEAEPSREAIRAFQTHKLCIHDDKMQRQLERLRERLSEALEAASGESTGWAIPYYIVACESGGDYGAGNASGAYGAYQIMPSTAAAYGCDLSTPAGQDACAAEIWADVGASAWSCA